MADRETLNTVLKKVETNGVGGWGVLLIIKKKLGCVCVNLIYEMIHYKPLPFIKFENTFCGFMFKN